MAVSKLISLSFVYLLKVYQFQEFYFCLFQNLLFCNYIFLLIFYYHQHDHNDDEYLKYILNTHHYYDHVGGNKELKKKYNSKIIGFKDDKDRIPEIDILVENNQIWKNGSFEAKIYHIPGHTTGHIAFHFFKEKKIFTGDTLFSLGCGKIFEGTYEQMFNSLNRVKSLPKDTEIFCGHEYTLKNAEFCLANDSSNLRLKEKIVEVKKKLENNLPSIPSILSDEIECNIFLKATDLESFSKLRDLKDNF